MRCITKGKVKVAIVILAFCLIVGYASITTIMSLSGIIRINSDPNDFTNNIIFKEADMDQTSKSDGAATIISADGKTISFSTQTLDVLNETSTLNYKIQNNSQYNALVGKINCVSSDTKYIEIVPAGTLENQIVKKGNISDRDTISIILKHPYEEKVPKTITVSCTLNATAQPAS